MADGPWLESDLLNGEKTRLRLRGSGEIDYVYVKKDGGEDWFFYPNKEAFLLDFALFQRFARYLEVQVDAVTV